MAKADLGIRPNGRLRRLGRWWHESSFRFQVLFAIFLVTLLASLVSGMFAVVDARERAKLETRANIELWSNHILPRAREIKNRADLIAFVDHLAAEMANVRHVTVDLYDEANNPILPRSSGHHTVSDAERAPAWFVHLVQPDIGSRSFSIGADGKRIGSVVITGVPDDEIAEAWDLLSLMALLWLSAIALMMVGLYFILNFILHPLAKIGRGLHELESGDYAIRLDMPRVKELEAIAASFNKLAVALEAANDENSRLYRQLLVVQEEERREISRELHDEFGPCLFGIRAGTAAVTRHARNLPEEQANPILSCVEEIVHITDHLKGLNRALLKRLRPMALDRHSIGDLIAELIVTFERRHANVQIEFDFQHLPATFGEATDLAIYRCVQEGLTNAIRHGQARTIKVDLTERVVARKSSVSIAVSDTGLGMTPTTPFGYGLAGMRERVRQLHGSMKIEPNAPQGTTLSVVLPLSKVEQDNSAEPKPDHS